MTDEEGMPFQADLLAILVGNGLLAAHNYLQGDLLEAGISALIAVLVVTVLVLGKRNK